MRTPHHHSSRRAVLPVLLCAAFLALGVAAPAANAAAGITTTQPNPVVGEQVTYGTSGVECGNNLAATYTWSVDNVQKQSSTSTSFTTSFTSDGQHVVDLATACPNGGATDSGSRTVDVNGAFSGTISVSPDPPYTNEPTTLEANQSGGYGPPYTYDWDTDNDGSFDDSNPDGSDRVVTPTYTSDGPQTVRVRIRDSATPKHEVIVTRTITLGPRPAGTSRPADPPCTKRLSFALSEFTTGGCFTNRSGRWETTSAVKLNGISFPDYGQTFAIAPPTPAEPGGRFTAPRSAIKLGQATVYSGNIDWTLPAGGNGDEKVWKSVAVPPFAELFSLAILGSTEIRLGRDAAGKAYAVFPLNVQFPEVFNPAPTGSSGNITGSTSVRVDEAGPKFDGIKIKATDAYIGRIRVPEVCFSYVPSGGTNVAPCEKPSLDGEPYLTCQDSSATTDRWDGNGVLELPVDDKLQYSVFGGLADGRLTSLGGFADNIGALGLKLAPGVDIERLGGGVCLEPPPLKVRGDLGVGLLTGKLRVDGRFVYTDPYRGQPWQIETGGAATMAGTKLGEGSFTFNAWGDVNFALATDINADDLATLKGRASGWVEPRNNLFNVTGSFKGCLVDTICAGAEGLVSSTGVAGCFDAGEIVIYEPVNPRQGPFGFGSISLDLQKHVYPLKAGFGYKYRGDVDFLGNSCDFSAYSATKSSSAQSAAATLRERIAPGTKAVSLRVHGTKGAPKIVVRGPHGTRIVSLKDKPGRQRKGRWILAENRKTKTTSVMLVKPAPGVWSIAAAPGARSRPTRVDRSNFEAPPAMFGQVRWISPYHREAAFEYALPAGAKVRLVERSKKGVARTLVKDVRGKPCRGAPKLPGGRTLLCVRKKFRVARGPGGNRVIQAVVSRNGIPLARRTVARFRAPRQPVASRVGPLSIRRKGSSLIVVFPRSRNASRYSVVAILGNGRRQGFDLAGSCRAVRIPKVAKNVAATVKVAGVRYDVKAGRYRSVKLRAGRNAAGPARKLPKKICR
jgi:hypothetical protein